MTITSAWAPISKSVDQDDGTIFVYGKATDDALDRDFQRCDPNWLNQAMPEWYRTGANIREQHDRLRAVGVGISHEIAPDGGHYVKAHIVDPLSVLKVKTNVLKGFSIGIANPHVSKSADAPRGLIDGGDIVELTLCDRPSNPGCMVQLAKTAKPGMTNIPAGDYDHERRLVRCEELIVKTDEPDSPELTVTLGERLSPDVAERLRKLAEEKTVESDVGEQPESPSDETVAEEPADKASQPEKFDRDAAKALVAKTVANADAGLGQDESGDISGALQAISIIAELIQSEAKDLGDTPAQGCDIDLLMEAVHALRIFNCREAKEQAGIDPGCAPMMFSADADVTKDSKENTMSADQKPAVELDAGAPKVDDTVETAVVAEKAADASAEEAPAEEVDKSSTPEISKAADVSNGESLVKALSAALEKADNPLRKTFEAIIEASTETVAKSVSDLAERLVKVEGMAVPGGPALRRTEVEHTNARKNDLMVEAARYKSLAAANSDDFNLRKGYDALAAQLDAQIKAL